MSLPVLAQQRPGPPLRGSGDAASSSSVPLTEDQIKAQQHFQKAKELYGAGSYREAVAELEIARNLDPKAKDLVMNLGIVHEKLGKYDEAVVYFKSYLEMEGVTPAERAKVEGMIKRIEGAKREVPTPTTASASASTTSTAPPSNGEPPPRGRIDAQTVVAASVAAVGLLGGTALGIYALTSQPNDFVTGRDGSYSTLQQKADDAHTVAIIADVSLAVGVMAAIATAYLYFARTKDPAAPSTGSARVSSGTTPSSSGLLFLRGTF